MNINNNINKERPETLYLWWLEKDNKRRNPAGVAFYDGEFGDYRLKLDMFPMNRYYLRCVKINDSGIHYRLEAVQKDSNGNFIRKVCVGEGLCSSQGKDVYIKVFSLEKTLALTLKETSFENEKCSHE